MMIITKLVFYLSTNKQMYNTIEYARLSSVLFVSFQFKIQSLLLEDAGHT